MVSCNIKIKNTTKCDGEQRATWAKVTAVLNAKGKAIRIHSVKQTQTLCTKITQKQCARCCKLHVCFTNVLQSIILHWPFDQLKGDESDPQTRWKKCTYIRTQSRDRGPIRISQTAFISPWFIREFLHTQSSSETFCLIKSYDRWRFVRQRPMFGETWREKNILCDRNGRLPCGCVWIRQTTHREYFCRAVRRNTLSKYTVFRRRALLKYTSQIQCTKFQRKPTTFHESLWKSMSEAPQMFTAAVAAAVASVKYVILVHYVHDVNVRG